MTAALATEHRQRSRDAVEHTAHVDDPGDLLAIPVADRGWTYAGDLTQLYRAWVGPLAGRVDAITLNRLDGALRAALDL